MVTFDLEALHKSIGARRVGLAVTPAAWLPQRQAALTECPAVAGDVRAFLALEHGLRGELQDGVHVESYADRATGLPVFSFYGERKTVPDAFWEAVDVAVFCAQDASHRAYTFHWALAELMATAAVRGKAVVVLDRPSPLAWLGAAGPVAAQFFPLPFPMLPALTHGELGLWLKQEQFPELDLHVLPAQCWTRSMPWAATGLPWIPPSPNLPSPDSILAYACTGILQATTVAEGRGTCRPFEFIGAPFIRPETLAAALNARKLPGVYFREIYFAPAFNKFAGQVCGGVHLMFDAAARPDPVRTQFVILQELARLYPQEFELKPGFAVWLDNGAWTPERLRALDILAYLESLRPVLAEFAARTHPARLYPE